MRSCGRLAGNFLGAFDQVVDGSAEGLDTKRQILLNQADGAPK